MDEWLRRWTANPIQIPCVGSKPISVGVLLGTVRKIEHAEIQAPHSKQQIQCLENIWFKKSAKKTTDKCEHTLSRRCWTNLVTQRKRNAEKTAIFDFCQ